jgi:integrase
LEDFNTMTADAIKVSVLFRKARNKYFLQYRDPISGSKVTRATDTRQRREADRLAAVWQDELNKVGQQRRFGNIDWQEFRTLYEEEHVASLADRTADKICGVLNVLEKMTNPRTLADVDENLLSRYQTKLRNNGRSDSTIKSHLAHIVAALSWAKSQRLIAEVPIVRKPKRAKKSTRTMKGRPLNDAEFEQLLAATSKVVTKGRVSKERKPLIVASWKHLLQGMWWSGLRLSEAVDLHWTDRAHICVEGLETAAPMFWIPDYAQKSHEDELLPMAPEFVEFLRAIPPGQRSGFVFNPQPRRNRYGDRLAAHHVGRTVAAIGESEEVKVRDDQGKVKFASAHDLRRSFGDRWSTRVMPPTLQKLMRHDEIQTTMRYYVGRDAEAVASVVWAAYGQVGGQSAETGDHLGDHSKPTS